MHDPETPPSEPVPAPVAPVAARRDGKRWGCLQWGLLIVAVLVLLCGLCTVVVLSNTDFR